MYISKDKLQNQGGNLVDESYTWFKYLRDEDWIATTEHTKYGRQL